MQKQLPPAYVIILAILGFFYVSTGFEKAPISIATEIETPTPNPTPTPAPVEPTPVKAVIKGPSEVLAGALTFLSSDDAQGDNKVWMLPDDVKQASAICGNNIFFSMPKPGLYRFGLIVANKEAAIDYVFHIVKVVPPGDSGPGPGPTDPPPPSADLTTLQAVSTKGLAALNDPVTKAAMRTALQTVVVNSKGLPLEEAKTNVSMNVEITLARRPRDLFKTKDWITLWRVPVYQELAKLKITNTEQYLTAISAVAETCK